MLWLLARDGHGQIERKRTNELKGAAHAGPLGVRHCFVGPHSPVSSLVAATSQACSRSPSSRRCCCLLAPQLHQLERDSRGSSSLVGWLALKSCSRETDSACWPKIRISRWFVGGPFSCVRSLGPQDARVSALFRVKWLPPAWKTHTHPNTHAHDKQQSSCTRRSLLACLQKLLWRSVDDSVFMLRASSARGRRILKGTGS